ncbi:MAG: class IV adenylate cyclase [Chrysiogenales bacterium]
MNTEKRLEIEVKIKVQILDSLRQKIKLLPAALAAARVFERNIVFDTTQKRLRKRGILLRLRQQGAQAILTMKMPVQDNSIYKVREETEVEVSDFANMGKIFRAIGFRVFFIYEKYREVFNVPGARIMIDETPIGNFIEIEGDPERIDAVAARLGFTAADYITDSYYQLFLCSGGSGHMVFAE